MRIYILIVYRFYCESLFLRASYFFLNRFFYKQPIGCLETTLKFSTVIEFEMIPNLFAEIRNSNRPHNKKHLP